jgi:hypothetical protein
VGASPRWGAPVGGRDQVGAACSGGAMRAVWPAAKVNGGGGAPAVGGDKEVVRKLQGGVGKLEVEAIGVEEGRRGVPHGEQETAADGGRRQRCSGRNWRAFGARELEQRL